MFLQHLFFVLAFSQQLLACLHPSYLPNGKWIPVGISPTNSYKVGAILTPQCKNGYAIKSRITQIECKEHDWSIDPSKISCEYLCGEPLTNKKHNLENEVYYPWLVLIYANYSNLPEPQFLCTGTLLSDSLILTTAGCVVDSNRQLQSEILISTGKHTLPYSNNKPTGLVPQFRKVSRAHIKEEFIGKPLLYLSDVALLVANTRFNLDETIHPICIDWNYQFDSFTEFTEHIMIGWDDSKLIKYDTVEYIPDNFNCSDSLQSFSKHYFTVDKICVHVSNSGVCGQSYGGGVYFNNKNSKTNNKFYLKAMGAFRDKIGNCNPTFLYPKSKETLLTIISNFNHNFLSPVYEHYHGEKASECIATDMSTKSFLVHSKTAVMGSFPWHVGLHKKTVNETKYTCGGSIICKNIVVTAAHCVSNTTNGKAFNPEEFFVSAGAYFSEFEENMKNDVKAQRVEVKEIIVHMGFAGIVHNFANDIAILKTRTDFIFSINMYPVQIDWNQDFSNTFFDCNTNELSNSDRCNAELPGWGYTENAKVSDKLRYLHAPHVSNDECLDYYGEDNRKYLTNDKFCAGTRNSGMAPCGGDSGGGLVYKNQANCEYYLVGIVSVAFSNYLTICDKNQYTMYTKIELFLDFIRKHYTI